MNRLFNEIRQWIESGEFKPGELLPSVSELPEKFDAGEDEVREAISELIYEGYVERVRPEPFDRVKIPDYELWGTLTGIHSITREARKRGMEPGVEILSFETVTIWPSVAKSSETTWPVTLSGVTSRPFSPRTAARLGLPWPEPAAPLRVVLVRVVRLARDEPNHAWPSQPDRARASDTTIPKMVSD